MKLKYMSAVGLKSRKEEIDNINIDYHYHQDLVERVGLEIQFFS